MSSPGEIALPLNSGGISVPGAQASAARRRFTEMVASHAPALLALATRLSRTRADAEDLVQETFLKAWRALGSYRPSSRGRAWLLRILLNTARDRGRRRKVAEAARIFRPEPAGDPVEGLARREQLDRVLDVVHALPRRQREALLLRARGGLSHREIAEVMGIREGAVKSHLVQARRALARKLPREVSEW